MAEKMTVEDYLSDISGMLAAIQAELIKANEQLRLSIQETKKLQDTIERRR